MFKRALISILMLVFAMVAMRADAAETLKPNFHVGQEWSIKAASPMAAKVVIGRIEDWHGKIAIHVSIIDILIPQGMRGAGGMTRIGHAAFEKSALAASVDHLLGTKVSPASSFETGYGQWKAQQGDLSAVSVTQTIAFGLAAMDQMR